LEDCKFCTQSIRHKASIERYTFKDEATVIAEAKRAKEIGAIGFCLVTSGKGLDEKSSAKVANLARAIKNEVDISLIACNGTASVEQLRLLKDAGIENYNHNLETSQNYYRQICTTHSWSERYQTCLNVKEVGLNLCTGGIFGMGESIEDRESLLDAIASLEPMSVPLNFFHPNEALSLSKNIDINAAFEVLDMAKRKLPKAMLMVAGGREITFGTRQKEIFAHGINAIVIGDYLTTKGQSTHQDIAMLNALNLEIATTCHE
jgi:biotin synthase